MKQAENKPQKFKGGRRASEEAGRLKEEKEERGKNQTYKEEKGGNTVVPPSVRGMCPQIPSGCLKPRTLLNPIYTMFFVHMHTYDKISFINQVQ